MKNVKLNKKPYMNPYCELSQEKVCKFSWLEKVGDHEYCELFSPVKCKDYLEDLMVANIRGLTMKDEVYSFKYEEKVDLSGHLYTSILCNDKDECDKIVNNIKLFKPYEKRYQTLVHRVFDHEDTIVIRTPHYWLTSPMLYSIYTLSLRLMLYLDTDKESPNSLQELYETVAKIGGDCKDSLYVDSWLKSCDIDMFLKNSRTILREEPLTGCCDTSITQKSFDRCGIQNNKGVSIYTLHDNTGFNSFGRNYPVYLKGGMSKKKVGYTWYKSYDKVVKKNQRNFIGKLLS